MDESTSKKIGCATTPRKAWKILQHFHKGIEKVKGVG